MTPFPLVLRVTNEEYSSLSLSEIAEFDYIIVKDTESGQSFVAPGTPGTKIIFVDLSRLDVEVYEASPSLRSAFQYRLFPGNPPTSITLRYPYARRPEGRKPEYLATQREAILQVLLGKSVVDSGKWNPVFLDKQTLEFIALCSLLSLPPLHRRTTA